MLLVITTWVGVADALLAQGRIYIRDPLAVSSTRTRTTRTVADEQKMAHTMGGIRSVKAYYTKADTIVCDTTVGRFSQFNLIALDGPLVFCWRRVVTDIEAAGGHAREFQADVSEESQVTQLFDDVVKVFGRAPNGLVNNAGIMEPWLNDIATIEFDTLERDIRTNLYGPWFCTREFVKRASTSSGGKGGSIVNVSSTSAASSQPLAY
eukprot:scaffold17145_cov31-Attheya_sp.AAC.1